MPLTPQEKLALIRAGGRIDYPPKNKKVIPEKKDSKKKTSKKKVKIDFYKLAEEVKKSYAKEEKYKETLKDISILEHQEKFKKSIGGKIGNTFRKGVKVGRLGITKSLYNRGLTSDQRHRLAIQKTPRQQRQAIPQRPRTIEERNFDNIFRSATPMAHHVERMITQPRGIANEGDNVAFNLARPGFGNVFEEIEKQVNFSANIQHLNPVADVSKNVMKLAKILK